MSETRHNALPVYSSACKIFSVLSKGNLEMQPLLHSWDGMSPNDHFVQFYINDLQLLETLESYVAYGIRAGESAIVIATAAHCR